MGERFVANWAGMQALNMPTSPFEFRLASKGENFSPLVQSIFRLLVFRVQYFEAPMADALVLDKDERKESGLQFQYACDLWQTKLE